ncbi:hypothetical protein ACFL5O_09255 [Myxococcota bacterium]
MVMRLKQGLQRPPFPVQVRDGLPLRCLGQVGEDGYLVVPVSSWLVQADNDTTRWQELEMQIRGSLPWPGSPPLP